MEDRKGHDFRYAIAPDKIKADLSWEPETPFEEGIKLTIAWYLSNFDWMERITKGNIRIIIRKCIKYSWICFAFDYYIIRIDAIALYSEL